MTIRQISQILDTYEVSEKTPHGITRVAVVVQQEPIVSVLKGTLTTAQQIEATKLIRQQQDARRATSKGGI